MKCDSETAELEFRDLAKETGLVTEERSKESLRFIHLTFCEFLAAFEAVEGQKDGWNNLIRHHGDFQKGRSPQTQSRLLEVIPFAAGLLTRIKRPDAMTDMARGGDYRLAARCYLETKAYDHSDWPPFVDQMRLALLGTPEKLWNEAWLRDLHLFSIVIRDQQQCAVITGDSHEKLDLGDFYADLASKQENSLASLLSAYASQDAAAALRLAEVCNLDILEYCPGIIGANLDQGPFFELIVHVALNDSSRLARWCVLFGEAALRSSVVAGKLTSVHISPKLDSTVQKISSRRRWRGGKLDSLYGQVITVALAQPNLPSSLSLLHSARPCGNALFWRPSVALVLYPLTYLMTVGLTIVLQVNIPVFPSRLELLPIILAANAVSAFCTLRLTGRFRLYCDALNLHSAYFLRPDKDRLKGWMASEFLDMIYAGTVLPSERQLLNRLRQLRETGS